MIEVNFKKILLICLVTYTFWIFINPNANPQHALSSRMAEAAGGAIVILALGFGAAYISALIKFSFSKTSPAWEIWKVVPYILFFMLISYVGTHAGRQTSLPTHAAQPEMIQPKKSNECFEHYTRAVEIVDNPGEALKHFDGQMTMAEFRYRLQFNLNLLRYFQQVISKAQVYCRENTELFANLQIIWILVENHAKDTLETARALNLKIE